MEPDDEFDSVPFDSFTAEEEAKLLRVLKDPQTAPFVLAPGVAAGAPLDEVDAAAAEDNAPDDGDGALPKVLVEIESSQGGLALGNNGGQEEQRRAEQQEQEMLSLFQRYRQSRGTGALSVSDLIGPLWCEVQHTYRLKSRSHLPPSARPTTIVGSTGASIELDQKRTAAREDILNKGRKVHAKLEKQVMGETQPVQVAVTGAEEWWALRCLNLLVCLDALFHTGEARELPVFGYVGSLLVFGVIDDVARRELPPAVLATPPSKKRKGVQGGSSKKKAGKEPEPTNTLDKYFATGSQSQRRDSPEIPAQDWGFIVSDTKTRRSRYAPRERDTLGPRFQVMLYFRFLRSLLSSNGNTDTSGSSEDGSRFPWARLASERALSLGAPLSQAFRDSITPAVFGSELVESLLAHTLAETPALPSQGDAGASAPDDANSTSDTMTLGHLIRALETFGQLLESDSRLRDDLLELTYVRRESSASVISPPSSSAVAAAGLSSPASPESGATSSTASLDPSASQQSRGRRRKTPAAASSSIETSGSSGGGGGASSTSILAQMVFKYDKAQLDGWLTRATQLWNGETEPLGVPPAEVFKCRLCEFENDCEWRAAQASKATERYRQLREADTMRTATSSSHTS